MTQAMKTDTRIMKCARVTLGAIVFLFAGLESGGEARAADTTLAHLAGTIRFRNVNPQITDYLRGEFLLGGNGRAVHAASDAGCAETATTTLLSGDPGDIGLRYALAVVASPSGPRYTVGGGQCGAPWHLMPETLSPAIVEPGSVTPVDLEGCIQLLRVRFEDEGAGARPVNRLSYFVFAPGRELVAYQRNLPPTATLVIALPSHRAVDVEMHYETGSDFTLDTAYFSRTLHVEAACDVVTDVSELVPAVRRGGGITGRVNMADLGLTANREHFRDGPLYLWSTVMAAYRAPRDGSLEGGRVDRAVLVSDGPEGSSGPFSLPNLPDGAYSVYARMQFGSGGTFNVFQTPVLPNVSVSADATNDLGETFVIQPGRLTGEVELRGPGGGMRHLDLDGEENTLLERTTSVVAHGAPNDGFPPAGGVATGKIAGVVAAADRFVGRYSLMLGKLGEGASQWDLDALTVRFDSSTSGHSGGPYLKGAFRVQREERETVPIVPGSETTLDLRYCLGEVTVRLTFGTNLVFNPRVEAQGDYSGPDVLSPGALARYSVRTVAESGAFEGTPVVRAEAATEAVVHLYLPVGAYTLYPRVQTVGDGGQVTDVPLPALTVKVLSDCLPASCSGANLLVNGSFEEPTLPDFYWQTGVDDPLLPGWRTLGEGVEYHANLAPGTVYPVADRGIAHGFYAVDLASVNGPGGIQQTFPTVPGRSYTVAFSLGTQRDRGRDGFASLTASAAGVSHYAAMENDTPNTYFTRHQFPFQALGSTTTLAFTTTNQADRAFVELDDVWVGECCLELFCPPDLTVSCQGTNGAMVTYSPYAVDHCTGADPVTWCMPPSGSWFPVGVSEVTCFAVSGGITNSCRFAVTVLSDCPPVQCVELRCPEPIRLPCASPNGTAVHYSVFATNHCTPGDLTVYCDPPSGSLFRPGVTQVRCVAIGSGQTNACSFEVAVLSELRSTPSVTIEWDCGVLEASDRAEGPYSPLEGATSTYVATPNQGMQFFRVRKP